LGAGGVGLLLGFGGGIGEEASDGEQEDGAQAEAEPGGGEQARGFADGYGRADEEPEEDAGAGGGSDGVGEDHADGGEQDEEGVNAEFDAEPTA